MSFEGVSQQISAIYQLVVGSLPASLQSFASLFSVVILMVIYSVFIWKLYRFVGRKDIVELDLKKYNTASHPIAEKFFATLLYLLKYIVILPIVVFFWFAMFTVFLVLVMNLDLSQILFISAAVIATVRIISYIPGYGKNLAQEVAKLLPLNLLALALLTPGFFDAERIIGNIVKVGDFFGVIVNYLIFILVLEIVLRFFDLIFTAFGLEEQPNDEDNTETEPEKKKKK